MRNKWEKLEGIDHFVIERLLFLAGATYSYYYKKRNVGFENSYFRAIF
jgi:hypothetical protein